MSKTRAFIIVVIVSLIAGSAVSWSAGFGDAAQFFAVCLLVILPVVAIAKYQIE